MDKIRAHFQRAVQDRLVSADGVEVVDLGVNPLSVVVINLRPLNNTATLANYASFLDVCAALNSVRLLFRGQSIVSMKGEDIAAMNVLRRNVEMRDANTASTDNHRRNVMIPLFLGRFAGDPLECFPASRRGELTLELDIDIADTGYDGFRYSVDTLELLGARPKYYERCVAINRTFPATGFNDIPLPVGNVLRGIGMWGTTYVLGTTPTPSIGRSELLLDNQQMWNAGMDFETAIGIGGLLGGRSPVNDLHQHTSAAAGSATTNRYDIGRGGWERYGFIDFDLLRNDLLSVETAGVNQCLLRCNAGAADAVRIFPFERVTIDG